MTKQEFWKKIGHAFELYDIPCEKCPAYNTAECDKSCEYALKTMYGRLELLQKEECKGSMVAKKLGDKAKVIETWSAFYGETVTFLEEDDKNYVFISKKHNHARLIVPKDSIDDYVEWERESND